MESHDIIFESPLMTSERSATTGYLLLAAFRRLEEQLDETLDDLHDLGFDGQVLSNQLRVTQAELSRVITRCDHAMQTTEQRILQLSTR